MSPGRLTEQESYDYIIWYEEQQSSLQQQLTKYPCSGGGTAGCVIAGRLAEDTNTSILLVEAGPHNKDLENVHMVGGWSKNFDSETDWNLVTPKIPGIDNRQVKLSRGKFLGGSSGVNGTLWFVTLT